MPERLANKLKERRGELGLTQAELAELCGVTRKTVNTVENGIFTPSALLALKMAQALNVRVEGRLTFNGLAQILTAVRAGFGLAYLPEDMVEADIAAGRLRQVLDDWCPLFAGYHLYYPSRRQHSPAFSLLVDALRYRA